ncbi:hypothetical protein CKM354_000535900 [Cercospora kikuchii]|uniref:Uncharacterized protein n=1 Tax=Cercospora kikuchii TaxID=84275 RepID=A0A9P3CFS2_9PEZI|nr:uncharacterized protein CKM354_000535900 [Cercospora kikuchii]GIZ42079.1 hypothetical protein CKM354_000535900 [Cercospora kikuchii]
MSKMTLEQVRLMKKKPDLRSLATEDNDSVKRKTAACSKQFIFVKVKYDTEVDDAEQEVSKDRDDNKALQPDDLSFDKLQELAEETRPSEWEAYHVQNIYGEDTARYVARDEDIASAVKLSMMEDQGSLGHVFLLVEGEVAEAIEVCEWPPAVIRD